MEIWMESSFSGRQFAANERVTLPNFAESRNYPNTAIPLDYKKRSQSFWEDKQIYSNLV